MNHQEFLRLIYPYMDGELDAAKRHEVDVYLENSQEARAILDYETRVTQLAQEALTGQADMVAKGRLLASFRASVSDKPSQSEVPAEKRAAGSWSWQMPIAAAALFLVAWLGGIFERDPGPSPVDIREDSPSSVLIDVVNVSERDFRSEVARESKNENCRFEQVKGCLQPHETKLFWPANSRMPQQERLQACSQLVSQCMQKTTVLPCLPQHFRIVAARTAELKFKKKTIFVPHIVMMSDEESLSVYVICNSQSEEISQGLHSITSSNKKDACLLGCPQRGVVIRECSGVWLVLISKMGFKRLQTLAEGI